VGLILAAELEIALGAQASITIFESRWIGRDGNVRWLTEQEGNRRREQVVTLQSAPFSKLSAEVRTVLFPVKGFTEVWPYGPDSPTHLGKPRNVRIMDVEDRMLEFVKGRRRINLIARRFDPQQHCLKEIDILAVCDGAQSATRAYFAEEFGQGNSNPYSLEGRQLVDVILGLRVQSRLSAASSVVLTIAQNRWLFNGLDGNGFLNMRLTTDEASEVRGIAANRNSYTDCIQSSPCTMVRQSGPGIDEFVCPTHGTFFKPTRDATSFLWPRIQEGLKLFDADLHSITRFSLSMVQRDRFVAEVFPKDGCGTFVALLGDAANALHFWPGRGLNQGLLSAVSLTRSLARWSGARLRYADFTRHEAVMAALQQRHKSRAWLQMITRRNGEQVAISRLIDESLSEQQSKLVLLATMEERCREISKRLEERLGEQPDIAEIMRRLTAVNEETLRVMVASGQWETRASGGEEVDVDWFYPAVAAGSE
jgi:hypothetical protein